MHHFNYNMVIGERIEVEKLGCWEGGKVRGSEDLKTEEGRRVGR